jgi:hypothetical protein
VKWSNGRLFKPLLFDHFSCIACQFVGRFLMKDVKPTISHFGLTDEVISGLL